MRKSAKYIVAGSFTLVALVGLLAASWRDNAIHAAPPPDFFSLLPSGAPTLAFMDLATMRESPIYKNRKDRSPITVPNSDYVNFVAETGFDFEHDLDRVAIEVWPKLPSEERPKAVIVAEGRFDRDKIRAYAAKHGKIVQQMNHEVFLSPQSTTPARSTSASALTFLDDRHIGIVGGTDIAPLLAGHGIDAADPLRAQIDRVRDSAAFMIVHASAFPVGATMQGTPAAQFAGLAQTLDWVALAIGSDGENARVSLEGECRTPADAAQLHSTLEFVRQLGLASLANEKPNQKMDPATFAALKNLVAAMEIKQTDNRVRILIEITPEVLNLMNGPKAPSAQLAK